ncbi:hypothetical protein MPLB_1120073 [Mesorhizobium sp. ORS 3324]|nr:hypothetical protein MPLB_1120073 [Mesorhizobium sp. ORS 3324]
MSGVFVVGALDKGFVCGCQARLVSITANWRRFFDRSAGAAEIRPARDGQPVHWALRMEP